jgi:Copper amine oxidase N-terminal domain/Bacterial Ig domain
MAQSRRYRGMAMMALPASLTALTALTVTAQAKPPVVVGTAAELKVLSPLSSEVVPGKFAMNVDFSGKGVTPLSVAEMWVDGERWARQGLESPKLRGRLKFDVDATTLKPGIHTLMVRVIAEDGSTSSVTTQVVIGGAGAVPTVTPELKNTSGGPTMSFRKPGNGNRVSGVIEIEVDAPAHSGVAPYISFYVDKQWKTLKNFPPYSYSWDTTTVPNGYHTIEALGYLETTNATSSRKMQVFVDNVGGNTIRMTEIPDLSPAPKSAVKPLALPAPATSALIPFGGDLSVSSVGAHRVIAADRRIEGIRPVTPSSSVKISTNRVKSSSAGQLAMELFPVNGTVKSTAKPASVVAPLNSGKRPSTALPPLFALAGGAKPGTLVPVKSLPAGSVSYGAPKLPSDTIRLPEASRSFQVAFDGAMIAFDVAPRVENGMPLAPFRQIFEHTGGQVMWAPETKVVRAVNAEKEVIIRVGQEKATVNGTSVNMEKAAYIERGRTIVPLSFVGQALDVDVQYDPATGRLQIKSKN